MTKSDDRKSVVLSYLEENGKITTLETANLFGLKESRGRDVLKGMVDNELIEKVGNKRGAYYVLNRHTKPSE